MTKSVILPAKPTRLLIEKNEKGDLIKGRIEDTVLCYIKMQDGELAYGSQTERDYAVTAVVTEETSKNFKSVFPKNGVRALPNDQFTKSFRIDPPYPNQQEQYVIKFKSSTTYSNDIPSMNVTAGDLVPYEAQSRPKLFEVIDGKPVDVTMTSRAANGSQGVVAFRITQNKFGTFPTLSGVAITALVEAQQRASFESDFGALTDTAGRSALPAPSQSDDEDTNEPQPHEAAASEADWF